MTASTPATRRPQADVPPAPQRTLLLDGAVALLCAAAVWAPLALGATGEWTRLGLEATIAAAVILWAAASRGSVWALVLPVVILGTALLQLMPLPDRLLVTIAPISAGAWKIALAGTADGWGRISVDPAATAAAARRLFLGAALVAAVADLARCRTYRIWLTTAISAAAGLIIAAGLVFPVEKKQRIMLGFIDLKGPIEWWRTPLAPPVQSAGWAYVEDVYAGSQCYKSHLRLVGDAYGSYICCNKFAGAVCLTLPVALTAFLFWTRQKLPAVLRYAIVLAVCAGALWIVGVTISSRAGFAALVAGLLVMSALCIEYRPARLAAEVIAGGYGILLLAFVVMMIGQFRLLAGLLPKPFQDTLLSLLSDGRAVAASVATRMFRASPLLGTGLATYEDLCPRMMPGTTTWYYAHNDYAQFVAETGLIGGLLLLGCAIWLGRGLIRFAREASYPDRILAAGPWAALAAIGVHSAFDWNMHVPANGFLACVGCGLAAGSIPNVLPQRSADHDRGLAGRIAAAVLALTCVATLALLARDASTEAVAKRLREAIVADRIAAMNPNKPSPVNQLMAALDAGERAAKWAPRNPTIHVLLAQANVHLAARQAPPDEQFVGTEGDYLEAARRHSRAALLASPTIRGIPELARVTPKKPTP